MQWFSDIKDDHKVTTLVNNFRGRNFMNGEINLTTKRAGRILALAFKDAFPHVQETVSEIESRFFAVEKK
jgi:hypothetical protein